MNASELVYDRPGVYCRLYTCPECKVIFETFLDMKGNRLTRLDTWWRPAAGKESAEGLPPPGAQAEKSPAKSEKQRQPDVGKQPGKPGAGTVQANKPAVAESGAVVTAAAPPRPADQSKRVSILEMPIGGGLLPANKPGPPRTESKAKRGNNKKPGNRSEIFTGVGSRK